MDANSGIQTSTLRYPDLSSEDIENAVEKMCRRFYFWPKAIVPIVKEMLGDPQMLGRWLRKGGAFFSYLKERRNSQDVANRKRKALGVRVILGAGFCFA